MKTKFVILLSFIVNFACVHAQNDSLQVYYYENYPFAYAENGTQKGIEIEIIQKYVYWMKMEKNVNISVSYKSFAEFSQFYTSVKQGSARVIGLGSVTASDEREKEVAFSPAYMRNISVLVTDGQVPTVKSLSPADVSKSLGTLNALAVNKSIHAEFMNEIKKQYLPGLKLSFTENQNSILSAISKDGKSFGYVDIVAYWAFMKNNPKKFLKIQKPFSKSGETFGFIMPYKSIHLPSINEFFEKGFGFTSTRTYHEILEKYLGYEIINAVEIQ